MPTLQFQFQILKCFFSLADDVISKSYDVLVHILGEVFELVPIPGYFVDGYTRYLGKYLWPYVAYLKLT